MLIPFVLPPVVIALATGVASDVLSLEPKLLVKVDLLLEVVLLLGFHLGLANSPAGRLHRLSEENLHLVRLPSRPGHLGASFGQVLAQESVSSQLTRFYFHLLFVSFE